jgi:hypothetical protein
VKVRAFDDSEPTSAKYTRAQIELFVQTLLYIGAKSFSHSYAGMAKFLPVLKELAYTEEAQISVLRSLHGLWRDNPQMQSVLLNKLLRMGVVECAAVANWIFSKEMETEFTKCVLFCLLSFNAAFVWFSNVPNSILVQSRDSNSSHSLVIMSTVQASSIVSPD